MTARPSTGGGAEGRGGDDGSRLDRIPAPHTGQVDLSDLLPRHRAMLVEESGIAPEVIAERGYRSVLGTAELRDLGFSPAQRRVPGLLLPVCPPDGSNGLYCYRPDHPRRTRDGKPLKYELPAGSSVRLDVPPRCRPALADPSVPLWLTEGQKKADALASHGLCAAALLGVWSFLGRDQTGSVKLLADFDHVAWKGRTVTVVFDSDVMTKPAVQRALSRLTEHLQRKGALVREAYLPNLPDGGKCGVDDFLRTHSVAELEALVTAPRPAPQEPQPEIELLDAAPRALHRPLALIDGHAYAVTWLHVRTTQRVILDKKTGTLVQLDPPRVETARRLYVVRDDGTVFGDGGDQPLDALGLACDLGPSEPEDALLWRTPAVKRYRAGQRPDPVDVFARLVQAYDHFLDFRRSLGDQAAMCRLSACFSLMTWLAPAFTVLPYPWANGEWGSGKTKWLTIWARTSYLGQVVTWGGTFAALRDLADWGATLAFDDAESIDDPKADPEKRALLLAANRRGVRVPLKELAPDGRRWRIRWVDAFCPRGFSAKRRPTGALATRAIPLPLVRTPDPVKGNRDPEQEDRWPIDLPALRDDLWATALMLLPAAAAVWAELDDETELAGRPFEPWRALIAVARLFERHGVPDLEADVRAVMRRALTENADAAGHDLTRLVLLALCRYAVRAVSAVSSETPTVLHVTTAAVTEATREVAREEEADIDLESITERRVGRVLALLRFEKARDAKRKGWRVALDHLVAVAEAHQVPFERAVLAPLTPNGTDGTNGITASGPDDGDAGAGAVGAGTGADADRPNLPTVPAPLTPNGTDGTNGRTASPSLAPAGLGAPPTVPDTIPCWRCGELNPARPPIGGKGYRWAMCSACNAYTDIEVSETADPGPVGAAPERSALDDGTGPDDGEGEEEMTWTL